jgi:hypothetical protein
LSWTVDQMKVRDGVVYFAFTKIGKYMLGPPESLWVMRSPNLLSATDAANVTWELLPDGDAGIRPMRGKEDTHLEEAHVVPLDVGEDRLKPAGEEAWRRGASGGLGCVHRSDAAPSARRDITAPTPRHRSDAASPLGSVTAPSSLLAEDGGLEPRGPDPSAAAATVRRAGAAAAVEPAERRRLGDRTCATKKTRR